MAGEVSDSQIVSIEYFVILRREIYCHEFQDVG